MSLAIQISILFKICYFRLTNFPDQKLTRGAIRRTDSLEDSKDGKNRYDEEFDGKSNKQERMVVEKLG